MRSKIKMRKTKIKTLLVSSLLGVSLTLLSLLHVSYIDEHVIKPELSSFVSSFVHAKGWPLLWLALPPDSRVRIIASSLAIDLVFYVLLGFCSWQMFKARYCLISKPNEIWILRTKGS